MPTLWRTCRVLANRERLRILQMVLEHPDQHVSDVARNVDMTMSGTSQYLRALNARGLLTAQRVGHCVRYRMQSDKTLPEAKILSRGLKAALADRNNPVELIYREATAFTHPRRVEIFRVVNQGSELTKEELRERTSISAEALRRHLVKLVERGYLHKTARGCRCAQPRNALARVLQQLAGKERP